MLYIIASFISGAVLSLVVLALIIMFMTKGLPMNEGDMIKMNRK